MKTISIFQKIIITVFLLAISYTELYADNFALKFPADLTAYPYLMRKTKDCWVAIGMNVITYYGVRSETYNGLWTSGSNGVDIPISLSDQVTLISKYSDCKCFYTGGKPTYRYFLF